MRQVGNKMYDVCSDCGEIICLNKFLVGSFHLCVPDISSVTRGQVRLKYEINKKRLEDMK